MGNVQSLKLVNEGAIIRVIPFGPVAKLDGIFVVNDIRYDDTKGTTELSLIKIDQDKFVFVSTIVLTACERNNAFMSANNEEDKICIESTGHTTKELIPIVRNLLET